MTNQRAVALRPQEPGRLVALEPATPGMTLAEMIQTGKILAASGFFKDIKSQEQAVAKILWGAELGIGPVSAIRGIWVIEGQLSMSGNLMATLIKLSHDYDYRIKRLDDDGCVLVFYFRAELLGESAFDKEDALRAGLLSKTIWRSYPRNMYFNRAISNGFRLYCPHLSGGAPVYTPEELDADVEEDGSPRVTVSSMGSPEADQKRWRGRFFGRAKDLGYPTQAAIHAAFGLHADRGALGALVERDFGGDWSQALDALEAKGPYQPPKASDLLYNHDPDPVATAREQAAQALAHFAPPQTPADAVPAETVPAPEDPSGPPAPAEEEGYLGVCSAPGCGLPATGYDANGEPLCQTHGEQTTAAELLESTDPDPRDLVPLAAGIVDWPSFANAAESVLGLAREEVQRRLRPLGSLKWTGVPEAEMARRWELVQTRPTLGGAS
jgi:hypothetical protein